MKKESILSFYLKIQCCLYLFEKLNKPSLDIDNTTISWKSGKKVFNMQKIDLSEALKKIYKWMEINGYEIKESKQLENIWICSSNKNIYTLELLEDNKSFSCTCPRYTYKQEDCKHILMLYGKLILEGKLQIEDYILELDDIS